MFKLTNIYVTNYNSDSNITDTDCSLRGLGGARRKSCAMIPGLGLVSISPQMSTPPQKGGRSGATLSPAVSPTGAVRRKSFAMVESKVKQNLCY